MHSSSMCTARRLTISWEGLPSKEAGMPTGVCLSWGAGGCLVDGSLSSEGALPSEGEGPAY